MSLVEFRNPNSPALLIEANPSVAPVSSTPKPEKKKEPGEKKGILRLLPQTILHLMTFLQEKDAGRFSKAHSTINLLSKQSPGYWEFRFRELNFRACRPGYSQQNDAGTTEKICRACLLPWMHHPAELAQLASGNDWGNLLNHHRTWHTRLFPDMAKTCSTVEHKFPKRIKQFYGNENRIYLIFEDEVQIMDFTDKGQPAFTKFEYKGATICASSQFNNRLTYLAAYPNLNRLEVHTIGKYSPKNELRCRLRLPVGSLPSLVVFDNIFRVFFVVNGKLYFTKDPSSLFIDEPNCVVINERINDKITAISFFAYDVGLGPHGVLLIGTEKGKTHMIAMDGGGKLVFLENSFEPIAPSSARKTWNKPITSIEQVSYSTETGMSFCFDRFQTEEIGYNAYADKIRHTVPAPLCLKQTEGKDVKQQSCSLSVDLYGKSFICGNKAFALTPQGTLMEYTLKSDRGDGPRTKPVTK